MSHLRQVYDEHRHGYDEKDKDKSYLDPTFGQYRAFPSHGIGPDSEEVANYLRSVREEAENDDQVHFAPRGVDVDVDIEVQGGLKGEPVTVIDNNEGKAIDPRWCNDLLARFSRLKSEINRHHRVIDSGSSNAPLLPDTAAQCRKYILENDPPAIESFFTSIDRGTLFKLLIYFTKWLSKTINQHLSKWIWMTFLRIDNELEGSECSIIRDLAKKAVKLVQKVPHDTMDDTTTYTLDMIITLVGHYYGQKDLVA